MSKLVEIIPGVYIRASEIMGVKAQEVDGKCQIVIDHRLRGDQIFGCDSIERASDLAMQIRTACNNDADADTSEF